MLTIVVEMLLSFVNSIVFQKTYKSAFLVRCVVALILHICPEFLGFMVCGRNGWDVTK